MNWLTDWCEVQFRWLAFTKKQTNKKTKTNKVLQNCYCLNYKTNERQLASVPKWFVSCCFLSLCKMVRASLWSRSGGKSSQVEYLLCICVDVTFGYLGFSYFIDKDVKFFMRVACAETAFFFWKNISKYFGISKPAVLFDLVNPGRGMDRWVWFLWKEKSIQD